VGIKANDRPPIGRGHIVAAIAPPAEIELRQQVAGQLDPLDAVLFEKTLFLLKGLPELGVLLQVERELPCLVREVYGEHGPMFEEANIEEWREAESRVRLALNEFVQAAQSTYQGRLFAQDALQGLRLIDLTADQFDVVVMNPPFGAASHGSKDVIEACYPYSSNDLLAVFVERGLNLLRRGGRLGAITSRTCFFLGSFKDWRKKIVLDQSAPEVIADLGQGVMDDAMVEAAAYVLAYGEKNPITTVIRAIADSDRIDALDQCVRALRLGSADRRLFYAEKKSFILLPDIPFVYWASSETIKKFSSVEKFDPDKAKVCQGLSTSDNFRFVRAIWEVPYEDTIFCYYPTDGTDYCRFDDPIVQEYLVRRFLGRPKWAFHVMAGASQPWFSPITVKVQFARKGDQLRSFKDKSGKQKGVLRNPDYYHRPGISWTRRAVRFYPYAVPGNCVASASRYMAFPDHGKHAEALAVSASRMASAFLRFYGEKFEFPNFLVDNVKMLPWPSLSENVVRHFDDLINQKVEARRRAYQNFEPFHEFVVPAKVRDLCDGGKALAFDPFSLIGEEGERLVAEGYGFTQEQAEVVERDLREALTYQRRSRPVESDDEKQDDEEETDFLLDTSPYATEEAHVSYLLGCTFGRWDIRFATGEREPARLRDPFAPLPVCPPGMLQNGKGLSAQPQDLPKAYPIEVCWPGILVDDEGHPYDILEHVRNAAALIWGQNAGEVEDEACRVLSVKSLREYFRRTNGFFADHLKRYTKSSRRAPIYWPLSTSSGSYTIWLYYPRLTSQTLYIAINDFIEPKLKLVGTEVAALRAKGAARTGDDEKKFETLQDFDLELIGLRNTLLQIAPTYRPNHDDGVQITAAPLCTLFYYRPWHTVLKDTWAKLERGDYDWARLAMNYWPDRVRNKCETDKSLAIAHDLEDLYVEPEVKPKKSRGRKKAEGDE
jgi:hypothetical protein